MGALKVTSGGDSLKWLTSFCLLFSPNTLKYILINVFLAGGGGDEMGDWD